MAVRPCMNLNYEFCIEERKSIGHHLYWPKYEYRTELEIAFRNKPEHVVQMCYCAERLIHNMKPPDKPSLEEMIMSLTVSLEGDLPNTS